MIRAQTALAALAVVLAPLAVAQIPPPPPGRTQGDASTPPIDRRCDSAKRRVAKEERSLAAADDSIAKDKQAREGCAKSACARYDQAIKSMEARKSRHETRLAKFRVEAEKSCKPN